MTDFVGVDTDDQRIRYTSGNWAKSDEDGSSSRTTSDQSATATFDFEGVMITVLGNLSQTDIPQPLRYVLDGEEDQSFTLNASFSSSRTLYSSLILTPGNHSLALTLMSNATTLFLDGMLIKGEESTAETKVDHTSAIVGGTSIGVVFVLLLVAVVFLRRRRQRNRAPYSLGPLQASLPTSKEAFTSRKYSHYGISFTPSVSSSTETLPLPQKSRIHRSRNPDGPTPPIMTPEVA